MRKNVRVRKVEDRKRDGGRDEIGGMGVGVTSRGEYGREKKLDGLVQGALG
jgi:hypothetical protein